MPESCSSLRFADGIVTNIIIGRLSVSSHAHRGLGTEEQRLAGQTL